MVTMPMLIKMMAFKYGFIKIARVACAPRILLPVGLKLYK